MKKAKTNRTVNVKQKKNNILCIILKEGKGTKWVWLPEKDDRFSYDGNTYFRTDEGTYQEGYIRLMIYLEGVSLPIHHGYIEKETKTVTIKNRETGENEEHSISKIKGLKFDSKVIDIFLNRGLADEFTKQHMDLPNLIIIIILIANLITNLITIGLFFR